MAGTRDLATNICPVTFGADAFRVRARDIAEGEDLGSLRQEHAGKWSVQWEQGKVFFLPWPGALLDGPALRSEVTRVGQVLRKRPWSWRAG